MPEKDDDPVTSRLDAAIEAKKAAEKKAQEIKDAAADAFADAVARALDDGMKPQAVADKIGMSYETVRRIARGRGVKRLREPTVTSRRKADDAGQD
ncbi:hypothetical protein [Kitasatospora sp. NPDC058046]|uniref:hypothetical protein n=1 Tax=Kitasatospora sp. NPDC058046 TaxID=3346312 RepID=UPI0036DC88DF